MGGDGPPASTRTPPGKKLVDAHAARIARPRLERLQHQQRHQNGPAPVRDPRQVKREPPRQQNDFDGNDGHRRPGDHSKERQQDAGKDVGRARAAVGENGIARPAHVRGLGRIAGELQRKVRFDAGADVEAPAVEQRPPAMRALQAAQIDCDLRFEDRVGLAQVVLQHDVLRGDRGIGFQLEDPMPVGALQLQERGAGRLDAALECRLRGDPVSVARNDLEVGRTSRFTR